jgi:hypothetical protein
MLIGELFAFWYLKYNKKHYPVFYNFKERDCGLKSNLKKYNVIDPLLGWAIDYKNLNNDLYYNQCNSVVLETNKKDFTKDCFVLYISGGSTTDLFYDSNNWPVFLLEKFSENNLCAKIYISSVSGYTSGQELLKTIRDIDCVKPHLHISYSGANEVENTGYVSYFEQNLYNNLLKKREYFLFPNLLYSISNMFNSKTNININETKFINPAYFWKANMKYMHSLSLANNYEFIGVLQPVRGFSGFVENSLKGDEPYFNNWQDNQIFYPKAIETVEQHDFLYDFTNVLQTARVNPFIDDCHLNNIEFQRQIANKVFDEIKIVL